MRGRARLIDIIVAVALLSTDAWCVLVLIYTGNRLALWALEQHP